MNAWEQAPLVDSKQPAWADAPLVGTQQDADPSRPDPLSREALNNELRGGIANQALVGLGRGFQTVGEGAKGLALDAGNLLGLVDDKTVNDFDSKTKEGRDFFEQSPVGETFVGDAAEFAGEVLPSLVTGGALLKGATKGAQVLGKFARPAAIATVGGVEGALTSDTGNQAIGAALGGALGYGGDRLIGALTNKLGKRVTAQQIDRAIESAANRQGLNIDNLDDIAKSRLAEVELSAANTNTADNIAATNEFGIEATRGQLTGDTAQLAAEERLRNAGNSNPLLDLQARQAEQVQNAVNVTGEQLSRSDVTSNADLAQTVSSGLVDAASESKNLMRNAFRDAEEKQLDFARDAFSTFADDVSNDLGEAMSARLNSGLMPDTKATIDVLKSRLDNADLPTSIRFINSEVEAINKSLRSAKGVDQIGLSRVKNVLERKVDEAIDKGLYSGDTDAVESIRTARSLAKDYYSKFTGNLVEKLVRDDATPEMAMNFILGSNASAGQAKALSSVKQLKDIFEPNSKEMAALKGSAFNWIMRGIDTPTDKAITKVQLMRRINGAFEGKQRAVVNELFNKSEIDKIKRLARAVIVQQPDRINGSNSANIIGGMMRRLSGQGGLLGGLIFLEPQVAALASGSLFAMRKIGNRNAIKRATTDGTQKLRQVKNPNAESSVSTVLGGAVGADFQETFQ